MHLYGVFFFKGAIMKIEVINEKRLNHIHYCRVHKENQRLSGSFWVPSKSKSKNKKMFSIELMIVIFWFAILNIFLNKRFQGISLVNVF